MSYISVEELNAQLDQGMAVYEYYYPLVTGRSLKPLRKKMLSPFRAEKDPSFSVFMNTEKQLIFFKDSGADQAGSHWQFVMDLYGIDFATAIAKVKSDLLNISSVSYANLSFKKLYTPKPPEASTRVEIVPTLRDFNDTDLSFYERFLISRPTLDLFHSAAASSFDIKREAKTISIYEKASSPIYNFSFPSGRQKMYQPFAPKEFKWTSNLIPEEDVFGFDLIPSRCRDLFLIGGNKDAMSFFENIQLPVIALASESANLTQALFMFLRSVADHIWIFYDNDKQGYKKAEKFKIEYDLPSVNHLLVPYDVKDFAQVADEKRNVLPELKKHLLYHINK